MWKRRDLKTRAKHTLRQNYWRIIAVCFIIAVVVGGYGNTTSLIYSYNEENETDAVVENDVSTPTNSEILRDFFDSDTAQTVGGNAPITFIETMIDSTTNPNSVFFTIIHTVSAFVNKHKIFMGLVLLLGLFLKLFYDLFIGFAMRIGEKRFFMESRTYSGSKISRMFFLYRTRNLINPIKIIVFKTIFQLLWSFTLVMIPVKHYEYSMIPYIVAENPKIDRKAAFSLSKQMMKGNKWHAFILDFSFILWELLNIITAGLLNIFFLNAYKTGTRTELYFVLRQKAIDEKYLYHESLNDPYLVEHPAPANLVIPDVVLNSAGNAFAVPKLFPADQYPYHLYMTPRERRNELLYADFNLRPERKYSLRSLILLFFTFSVIGWLWEVSLHLAKDGTFVNRGTMFGPWLPIYGAGGILILVLLRRFLKNPILTFFLVTLICSIVEYSTSWYLEYTKGVKWWDYSGYFMNLNGRICLEGIVAFGLGGCAFLYVLAPRFDNVIQKIPKKVQTILCIVLLLPFMIDAAYSSKHPNTGKGITDYSDPAQTSIRELDTNSQTVPYKPLHLSQL